MATRPVLLTTMLSLMCACPPGDSPAPDTVDTATVGESDGSSSTSEASSSTTEDPSSTSGEPDDTSDTATTTSAGTSTSTTTEPPPPICGDGHVDVGEECDLGAENANEGACTESCTLPACGDGFVQRGEECDLGTDNDNQGECTNYCTSASCGDGFIQPGEECDEGEANNSDTNGGCHPETCTIVTTCGDGIVQEDEECDPSAQGDLAAACTEQCLVSRKVIFATSEFYSGNFGGLGGADAKCKDHAAAGMLPNPENFVAWLSTPDSAISERLEHLPVKYVRTDGVMIADGWDDLVDGVIKSPIRKDEFGEDAADMETNVWTGTGEDGGSGATACVAWTSGSFKEMGILGSIIETGAGWTNHQSVACLAHAHLYCIEV